VNAHGSIGQCTQATTNRVCNTRQWHERSRVRHAQECADGQAGRVDLSSSLVQDHGEEGVVDLESVGGVEQQRDLVGYLKLL